MALLTLQQAASRIDASVDVVAEWVRSGMLTIVRADPATCLDAQACIDDEELAEVAENEGWERLSAETWSDEEQ